MNRRLSASHRLIRALTALVTVWCLSCSAFEPLMAGLLGASPGMACGSEAMAMTASGEGATVAPASTSRSEPAQATISAGERATDGFGCSCLSCTVTAPAQAAVALSATPAYPTPVFVTTSFAEITREPLVPPPQVGTARA